jgi:hypothetical protein
MINLQGFVFAGDSDWVTSGSLVALLGKINYPWLFFALLKLYKFYPGLIIGKG